MMLTCGRYRLTLDRPLIMGIVNVTPDSFSDGGALPDADAAYAHAVRLIAEGADLLDIGGESTRPGAPGVALDDERRRVLPLLERLAIANTTVPVSVDTQKPALMAEALAAGASMINDINALQAPGALEAVAASQAAVCLVHKRGTPADMQDDPRYADVLAEVRAFLAARVAAAQAAGIAAARIAVDPGFGFGKTLEHNLTLLRGLEACAPAGIPVLAGLSRKAMLGTLTGRPVDERVHASVAAALLAVQHGARIVRVHDVAATRDALTVYQALQARV